MRGEDNNIEHHGDRSKELLQGGRIWGLKKIQEEVNSLLRALSAVTPTLLQTKFLEPVLSIQNSEVVLNHRNTTTSFNCFIHIYENKSRNIQYLW